MSKSLAKIMEDATRDKKVHTTSFTWANLRSIERTINKDSKSDEVVEKIKGEGHFGSGLDRHDWEKIKKEIKINFRLKS